MALRWMLAKAVDPGGAGSPGLRLAPDYDPRSDEPNPLDEIHESYSGGWKLLGSDRRKIAENSLVHASVEQRIGNPGTGYQPENLPGSYRTIDTPPLARAGEWRRVEPTAPGPAAN